MKDFHIQKKQAVKNNSLVCNGVWYYDQRGDKNT